MTDNNLNDREEHLLCPKRPIILALDKENNEVPLLSTSAMRKVTRFGRYLGKLCKDLRRCGNEK